MPRAKAPPRSKRTMTINRAGRFTIEESAPTQCKGPGHRIFGYTVRAKCAPVLDPNGFLIDHARIDRAVRDALKAPLSCERLAQAIADTVLGVLRSHGCEVRSIYVRVQPVLPDGAAPVAFIEVEEDLS